MAKPTRGVVVNYFPVSKESKLICQLKKKVKYKMSETTNEKYDEEEIKNINEIEELLDNYNEYISIEPDSSKILQFNPRRKIEEVERPPYNGQPVKKIRFFAIEQNSNSKKEKPFYVGRRSARLIIAKLKEGHRLLKIERMGSGKDTLYLPTIVESNK